MAPSQPSSKAPPPGRRQRSRQAFPAGLLLSSWPAHTDLSQTRTPHPWMQHPKLRVRQGMEACSEPLSLTYTSSPPPTIHPLTVMMRPLGCLSTGASGVPHLHNPDKWQETGMPLIMGHCASSGGKPLGCKCTQWTITAPSDPWVSCAAAAVPARQRFLANSPISVHEVSTSSNCF